MNAFTDLFIRRPVLASVVSLLILLIGSIAGLKLQIRQFPQTSNTTITITTTYPGAAADVIKGFITTPIEQAVASAEGIDTIVSNSQQNASTITLNLRLDANPDRAMADTLAKVNQVRGQLPREANDPIIVKQTGQGFALMYISFNSTEMTSAQITDYLTRVVQPLLQTVDGVAQAQILGGQTFAMRIWLDPTRMAALGVTANDVRAGFAGILLKPWAERAKNQKQVMADLGPKFANVTTAQVLAFSPPALPGSTGGPPMQFVIRTTGDYQTLADVALKLQQEASKSGLFLFTDVDLKFDTPQYVFKVDADKANRIGVKMQDIGVALSTMLGGNYVNLFSLQGRSYQVIPQAPRSFRLTPEGLEGYQVRAVNGELVPLSAVATVSEQIQPNSLTSFQQLNSATLSGVPFPGRTLGETLDFLKAKSAELFPEGYSYDFQGDSRQYEQEGNSLVMVFVFALIVIYLVLAAQYESFRDPFIILIGLPTALFGALLPLNIGGSLGLLSINIYTQIGLVTLIGLISKHGILMVDFANQLQEKQGYSRREAIEEAASVRLRPILMTTAAMVVGMIPLIIASGAGARSRADIGLTIFAGMSIGTLFTLFVTPMVYTFIARDHAKARAEAGEPDADAREAAARAI